MKNFKNVFKVAAATALLLAAWTMPAQAETGCVPGEINYQGLLVDPATGKNYVDGVYTLDLRVWPSEAGTTGCLWGGQYTVRVKDGHFNVMLGDPTGKPLTAEMGAVPQYGPDELWKVLWGMGSIDEVVHYLGITPHQDVDGRDLSAWSEISTRHRFMNTPFAVRAQSAASADGSDGNFTVASNLTVNGAATFKGPVTIPAGSTQTFGPLQASSTEILLTGYKACNRDISQSVYLVGNTLDFLAYGNIAFDVCWGDTSFNIPKDHSLKMTGSGSLVISTGTATTIGGSGQTTIKGNTIELKKNSGKIKYKQTATEVSIEESGTFKVNVPAVSLGATGATSVKATTLNFAFGDGVGKLAFNGEKTVGTGTPKWKGVSSGKECAPFITLSMTCELASSKAGAAFSIPTSSSYNVNDYYWHPVGWYKGNLYTLGTLIYKDVNGTPSINVWKTSSYASQPYSVLVYVIGVHKSISAELSELNAGSF